MLGRRERRTGLTAEERAVGRVVTVKLPLLSYGAAP